MSNETNADPPTCLNCRYRTMRDGYCILMAIFNDDYSPINQDTPACKNYTPEDQS